MNKINLSRNVRTFAMGLVLLVGACQELEVPVPKTATTPPQPKSLSLLDRIRQSTPASLQAIIQWDIAHVTYSGNDTTAYLPLRSKEMVDGQEQALVVTYIVEKKHFLTYLKITQKGTNEEGKPYLSTNVHNFVHGNQTKEKPLGDFFSFSMATSDGQGRRIFGFNGDKEKRYPSWFLSRIADEMDTLYRLADPDGDGQMHTQEFYAAVDKFSDRSLLRSSHSEADLNQDGTLDYQEAFFALRYELSKPKHVDTRLAYMPPDGPPPCHSFYEDQEERKKKGNYSPKKKDTKRMRCNCIGRGGSCRHAKRKQWST